MRVAEWMQQSGVAFGTSGARGLADALSDAVVFASTTGFLRHMRDLGDFAPGLEVALAADLRPSSPRIVAAVARAVEAEGGIPLYLGCIPTPALAAYAFAHRLPSVMVTGSHIPEERNGLKFNRAQGEILKADEVGIAAQEVDLPEGLCTERGAFIVPACLPDTNPAGEEHYRQRFLRFFAPGCLSGLRIGLYEHSSVGRDLFYAILTALGAHVTRLGRSDRFISVDTEAIREEDIRLGRQWAQAELFDALVSADGDADRPLLADATGEWLRGDVAGIGVAQALGAQAVVTPVSSSTALERTGWFSQVRRTRIGSPYVIEAMQALLEEGHSAVVGYEANGGFLQASVLERGGRALPALPTRDALVVAVTLLERVCQTGQPLSELVRALPQRFTHSDRLKNVPSETSRRVLHALQSGTLEARRQAVAEWFDQTLGPVVVLDDTDGLRTTFASGEIVHIRPSGNAPELRAYAEAETPQRAEALTQYCLKVLEQKLCG